MHGMNDHKPLNFGGPSGGSSGKNLFGRNSTANAPLGRSIRGRDRQPSGLSRQFMAEDVGDEDAEGEMDLPPHRGSLFRMSAAIPEDVDDEDAIHAEIDRYLAQEMGEHDHMVEDQQSQDGSEEGDMFLNMRHDDRAYGQPMIGDESDLMMLNTPAATDRVRREAESIFKRSSAHFGTASRKHGFQFGSIAKDLYSQHDAARVVEPADLILRTEELVCQLYENGVGTEDNAEKMDVSLADVSYQLVQAWKDFADELPQPEGEDYATIGPGPDAEPFKKANFVANLILRIHHTRFLDDSNDKTPPLPEILFNWLQEDHNLCPDQVREILRYKPSPACHSIFWQGVRSALLRGDIQGASRLLREAGWEHARRGPRGDNAYTGKALENVRRFAAATCDILDSCPAARRQEDLDWDVWDSSWTMFRVNARGALNTLTLFAEGKDQSLGDFGDDEFNPQSESLSTMARKASSQIPWDFYENLQTIYGILLGNHEAILEVAQDWVEATVGLLGWWDDGSQRHKSLRTSYSQSLVRASIARPASSDDYFDRLVTAFHLVIDSDMNPNAMNPVEVAIASAFEGNINAVLGFLRAWSLPLACTVAEIASLGGWLPETEAPAPLPIDSLDLDDLALLGVTQPGPDDIEGIKDTTLVLYARELAGIEQLSKQRDGWEMAIQVLGRMDSPQKSEKTVGELLRDLLAMLDEDSSQTVDKIWRILNDLGMINFAEETAEVCIKFPWDLSDETNNARLLRRSCQRSHTDTEKPCGTMPFHIGRTRFERFSTFSYLTPWFSRQYTHRKRTSTMI